jgi:ATP-dependent DNA ligase
MKHLQEFSFQHEHKQEFVILREPNSLYNHGKSENIRKFKELYEAEVRVLKNNFPHGFTCLQ